MSDSVEPLPGVRATDHAEVTMTDVRVPADAMLGKEGDGLALFRNAVRYAGSI